MRNTFCTTMGLGKLSMNHLDAYQSQTDREDTIVKGLTIILNTIHKSVLKQSKCLAEKKKNASVELTEQIKAERFVQLIEQIAQPHHLASQIVKRSQTVMLIGQILKKKPSTLKG